MLSREISIHVEGKTESDVEKAIKEAFRLIRGGDMSGNDGTSRYNYNFDVQESGEEELGEEGEDEDDETGYEE
ncbi:hypothetical protein [Azohydromonas australica]|uniref:hypothetical protein n=1 Tax=Azohydromonas australica TaxID=364039 RepID=UPI0004915E27|nr:hypothetical protein [Azohydromonas australica]